MFMPRRRTYWARAPSTLIRSQDKFFSFQDKSWRVGDTLKAAPCCQVGGIVGCRNLTCLSWYRN